MTPPGRTIIPVKSPKKPSKELSLPSQDESRRTNVLFEKLMSEFRTFGEGQADLRERVGRIETDLHTVKEDVVVLKSAVRTNGQEIHSLKDAVQGNTEDIRSLKEAVQGNTEAIHSMRADLKNINQRLEVVEAKS